MRLAFRILDLAARLLFALGVGCLLLAGYLAWMTLSFAREATSTTGEVVSYIESPDGDTVRYRPRIRFRTASGDIVTTSGQLSAANKRFEIGTQVPVVYRTEKPTEARVALFVDNWLGACLATVIGLVGLAGGYLVRRSIRRELARMPASSPG
jgi:hypothetical protein